jgi:hypothetical protein
VNLLKPRFYHQTAGKKPTEIANVPAEIQGITNRLLINKPSTVTNDTRLAIS